MEAALQAALARNPRLAAASLSVSAARSGARAARALTNPTFVFVPSFFGTGSDEELLLQQPLELNGTRSARAGVGRAQLRQAEAEAVVELRTVVSQTRAAYYELARARELRALAEEVLKAAEGVHQAVRRQAEEGLRPGIDSVQTQVEATRARQQVTLAEGQVRQAEAALNTLLGRPAQSILGSVEPLAFTPLTLDPEALYAQALSARAEIEVEEAQREAFRQEARMARAQGRPDLVPQFRTESVTRGPVRPGIGLGISLPLFDYGSRRHRVRQAEASARAQEARVEAARNQVRQEVVQALARLEAAQAVVRDYQGGVLEQSRQLRDASLRALQLGAPGATVLTVLETQRTYRGVLTDYTNALAQYAQAQAELERATGGVSAEWLSVQSPSGVVPQAPSRPTGPPRPASVPPTSPASGEQPHE